mmetsp:Transcript_15222/g.30828  ORF Transcript_15222/g.30828 Transcript_15222/m.30828 type:complete len:267 (-) Transcript_15222:812-1612(-)
MGGLRWLAPSPLSLFRGAFFCSCAGGGCTVPESTEKISLFAAGACTAATAGCWASAKGSQAPPGLAAGEAAAPPPSFQLTSKSAFASAALPLLAASQSTGKSSLFEGDFRAANLAAARRLASILAFFSASFFRFFSSFFFFFSAFFLRFSASSSDDDSSSSDFGDLTFFPILRSGGIFPVRRYLSQSSHIWSAIWMSGRFFGLATRRPLIMLVNTFEYLWFVGIVYAPFMIANVPLSWKGCSKKARTKRMQPRAQISTFSDITSCL